MLLQREIIDVSEEAQRFYCCPLRESLWNKVTIGAERTYVNCTPTFRILFSNLHGYVQKVKRALAICSSLLWILNLCFLTQPSEEEEIVDLMLMKICSLFGIKRKHAKDTRESDMSGGSGLAQNNNRNIFNTSSPDANIFQMSDKYVNP